MSTPSVLCLLSLTEGLRGGEGGHYWSLITDTQQAEGVCHNTRQSRAGAGSAEQVNNIIIIGLVYLTPQPPGIPGPLWGTGHCFNWLGWGPRHDRDQRGEGEDNILAGHVEILVMGTLRMLDAGLTQIDTDLCTDQGWIRRRFGIFRCRFGINRCSLVKFLGKNWCQIETQK